MTTLVTPREVIDLAFADGGYLPPEAIGTVDIAAAEAWRDKALAALKKGKEGYDQYATDVEEIFQERMAAAYKADLDRRDDWAAGGARAV